MAAIVYQELRKQLDHYSVGYPTTESGVEIKILEKFFTEEEAEIFLLMNLAPEPIEAIASRCGKGKERVEAILGEMYQKGLVYRHSKNDEVKYAAAPFIEGIYEYQVKSLDRETAQMFENYVEEALHRNITENGPLLIHRPIAINRTIDVSYPVPTYENSRQIIQRQQLIAVTDCICRVQKGLIEKGCDRPVETCFMFGASARYFIERSIGRQIFLDEALHILDACEDAGLVTMPFNTQAPANLCNCCPDCCFILSNLKKCPSPARVVKANYRAVFDPQKCEACDICLDRCPMGAILRSEVRVETIDQERCIGCGLCVSRCPAEALHLEAKPEAERYEPPRTGLHLYEEMAKQRGKSLIPLAPVK